MTMTEAVPSEPVEPTAPAETGPNPAGTDPISLLKGFVALRRLIGIYPAGHPIITQKLDEVDDAVQRHLQADRALEIDIIHDDVHHNGATWRTDGQGADQSVRDLTDLGIQSVHFQEGVTRDELCTAADFLWQLRDGMPDAPFSAALARRGVHHVSFGRIVPLDTRWRTDQWPEAPTGPMDPSYEESLLRAQETFDSVTAGRKLDIVTVHDLVELLTQKVARSSAALARILTVKEYENLTYCHSVNVAMISLLLGKQLGLGTKAIAGLVEAALLHDIGKTRVPVEIVKKPAALDERERKNIQGHTIYGAEILVETDGVQPLTPTVALEHHRGIRGDGYPDLGTWSVPHVLSQIVSVADVYEAITGARSYQVPRPPEQACLVLARQAGSHFNKEVVKAFVSAVTFFPIGSLVRTSLGETGIVTRTNPTDPLHPVLAVLNDSLEDSVGSVDTSARTGTGAYVRHIVETVRQREGQLDLARLLPPDQPVD
jgi:putative nucleotidyltransferase with HDIG domain